MEVRRLILVLVCVLLLLGTFTACTTDSSDEDTGNNADLSDSGNADNDTQDVDNDNLSSGEEDTQENQDSSDADSALSNTDSDYEAQDSDMEDTDIEYNQLIVKVSDITDGVYTLVGYESDADYGTIDWAQFDAAAFTESTQSYQMLADTNCKYFLYDESGAAVETTSDRITTDSFLRVQCTGASESDSTGSDTVYILAYEIYILPEGGEAE